MQSLAAPSPFSVPLRWTAVRPRFQLFNANLTLTPVQQKDGMTKAGGVLASLKRHYYGEGSQAKAGILIGSWGKETAGRPPRDVDMYFELPTDVYYRFERHLGNRQSALLQEVKNILSELERFDGRFCRIGSGRRIETFGKARLTDRRR
jgi:hypothetical protein